MSSTKPKAKKKKEVKKEIQKELPPQVVTKALADNIYTGIIRDGLLGEQYLECTDAKYQWLNGITYDGPFVQSRIEGKGRYLWPDGSSYEGELLNGKRHGQGVYMGADDITRYEGQWSNGKRDGNGKLTYNAAGTSFYDGGWKAGRKHGNGRQVWPSGNSYDGEWDDGRMSGEGMMTWRTGTTSEQYIGQWTNCEPHGQGTHTWHAVDLTLILNGGGDAMSTTAQFRAPVVFNQQQQQMNNRYEGQWVHSKRHGNGSFYYANGAYYCGEWKDHMKHGRGRYTFDDGSTYDGPFEEDRMTEYNKPPPAEGSELLSRFTDLSDMDPLALPHDRSGFEITAGAGYQDHGKIFREIYNMLLRYLGELRELYARYRSAIPRPGADPFALQSYQFWLFARDAGLLTPGCSLPRINRTIFNGPRHHGEQAPEDLPEVRPLRRAELNQDRRVSIGSSVGSNKGGPDGKLMVVTEGDAAQADGSAGNSEGSGSEASSSQPSPSNGGAAAHGGAGALSMEAMMAESEGALDFLEGHAEEAAADEGPASSAPAQQLGSRFWRPDAGATADVYAPARPILFRHFMEGIVRLAHTRFPHERGLEAQIQRIVKESVLPACERRRETSVPSANVFSFLANPAFQPPLKEFSPTLATLWSGVAGDTRDGPTGRHRTGLSAEYFGKVQRDLHVSARSGATARVRDVLLVLDRCGFLRKEPPMTAHVPSCDEEVPEQDGAEGDAASNDENGSGGSNVEKDFLEDRSGLSAQAELASGLGTSGFSFMKGDPLATASDDFADSQDMTSSKGSKKKSKGLGDNKEGALDKEPVQDASESDLALCDFSVTPLTVMKALALVLAPSCLEGVCTDIGGFGDLLTEGPPPEPAPARAPIAPAAGATPATAASAAAQGQGTGAPVTADAERTSTLDYMEMEIVYEQFVHLLIQMADQGTKRQKVISDRVPVARRFDGFMRYVFVPSLVERYAAPEMQEPVAELGEEPALNEDDEAFLPAETGSAQAEGAPAGEEGQEEEKSDEEAEAEVEEFVREPELWYGFDPASFPTEAKAAAQAVKALSRGTRRWPEAYAEEAAEW